VSETKVMAPVSRRPGALRLLSDERLSRRAAEGNEAAFAVIFERYHQGLYRYCRSLLDHDDASDALQNTMAAALRSLPGEGREVPLKPWLYRVAHNEAVSVLRRRRPTSELHEDSASTPGPEVEAEVRQRLATLTSDLRELPERQSGALVMRELNGLGYGEIAAIFGTSEAAAKQSVYNARLALQQFDDGRAMDCESVRASLSAGDGRILRALRMRAHLRQCEGCSAFEAGIDRRQTDLAMLAPPIGPLAAGALLDGLLHGGGGSAGGGGLLALLSAGGGKIAATSAAVKSATAVGAAIVLGAGVATVEGVPGYVPGAGGHTSGNSSQGSRHPAGELRRGALESVGWGSPLEIRQRAPGGGRRPSGKPALTPLSGAAAPETGIGGRQQHSRVGLPVGRGAAPAARGLEQAHGHVPSDLPAPPEKIRGGDGEARAPGSQAPAPQTPPDTSRPPALPAPKGSPELHRPQ
jgi:RNA polymerase sigma factor (sigma-70 family)